jgi:hypothetical protein
MMLNPLWDRPLRKHPVPCDSAQGRLSIPSLQSGMTDLEGPENGMVSAAIQDPHAT